MSVSSQPTFDDGNLSIPPSVPIFHPTLDEFKNFSTYVTSIEAHGAHRIGLAKIVPPKGWQARKSGYKQKQITETIVQNPIKQEVHGKNGIYSVYNIQQRSLSLNHFERLAATERYTTPPGIVNDTDKLERKYWDNLTSISPIYGADVSGTFYDENQTIWNLNNLGTILDDLESEYGTKIEGVNTAYLYFGMWKATFAWHTEDMDLYSINYLHFGAPKQWYVIPPSFGKKFEHYAASRFPALARRCPAFLRHKMTLIAPSVLTKQSIPYGKMTQNEGEFIITFPYAYHSGFNYGFNCAESTNFALERWLEYGKHSVQCACRHDMVKIGMDRFVLKYQPELYNDWCNGINLTPHPEDVQVLSTTKTIVRSIPTKTRLPINNNNPTTTTKNCDESPSSVKRLQRCYHEHISDKRYSCIFRNLAKFDKQQQFSSHPVPLIRSAMSRAKWKLNKNPKTNRTKLLCLTATIVERHSLSSSPILFHGLKQSGKYREKILTGLWNYQSVNMKSEQAFNQWLTSRSPYCSICYLLTGNKIDNDEINQSSIAIRRLLMHIEIHDQCQISNEILRCTTCQISVHRECYENTCLALNVSIFDHQSNEWHCQRCILKRKTIEQTTSTNMDDSCSICLLRGGLLLRPRSSSSFVHAICSIFRAYQQQQQQPSSQINSCHYCWSFCPLNKRHVSSHSFVSCNYHKCLNMFHVTCGLISGCTFQIDNCHSWPTTIHGRCHVHASSMNQSTKSHTDMEMIEPSIENPDHQEGGDGQEINEVPEDEDEEIVEENERIPAGTRVLINDTTEYDTKKKIGQIMANEVSFHYAVDFGDGSYSHDMLAEDLLDYDPSSESSTLIVGSNVRIKWTDGTVYTCKYLGRKRVLLYHIQMDNETRHMRRSEFSLDVPSSLSSQAECEHNYSRSQSLTTHKRPSQPQEKKRKRRRILSSSSSSSSSDES